MRYAIVNYPIPEEILKSGLIAQDNTTARVNNSKDKCVVSYAEAYHSIFRGYPTLPENEVLDFISKNPKDWDAEYIPSQNVNVENTQDTFPISVNETADGKVLYIKVHGLKAIVLSGDTHSFQLAVPYDEIYFQGAEILVDVIGVSNFSVNHPVYGSLEQYGYNVNMGTVKYIRESKYGARIPKGLLLTCDYTNDTLETLEVGVNFLMHEMREKS